MTWLRHAGRHVHHTAANYLTAQLTALGWLDDDVTLRPFGGTKLQILTTQVVLEDALDEKVQAGVVAITIGNELQPSLEEMGGVLSTQDYPLFIDCFHDSAETTLALATDVRDIFLGRLDTSQRYLDVINQADQVAAPGWRMEFNDVERVHPDRRVKLHWQVVHVTAETYFPEVNP